MLEWMIVGFLIGMIIGYISTKSYKKHLQWKAEHKQVEFINDKPYYIVDEKEYVEMRLNK